MLPDVSWFLNLCLESQALSPEQASEIISQCGENAELEVVSGTVLSGGYIQDEEYLQTLVGTAWQYAQDGYEAPELALPEVAVAPVSEGESDPAATVDSLPELPDFTALEGVDDGALVGVTRNLIRYCQEMRASDLHLIGGARPFVRHNRTIEYLAESELSPDLAKRINLCLLDEKQKKRFEEDMDYDYALTIDEHHRFRVNLMQQNDGVAGVYHIVPSDVLTLEELGFKNPAPIQSLLTYHNGLILVTGPVGAGKTTTLATLVNELNWAREDHIIMLEDPIEIVQDSQSCLVTQRQVGTHTRSFTNAIKASLREDPDVIVIGELRDLEAIEMAITASETGHLVIGTMHTSDAITTLSRLLDVFPPRQQSQIRSMTAGSLRGIICQRLLPTLNGELALAAELLTNINAVGNIIREAKEQELRSVMQTNKRRGMILMDESVFELWQTGVIAPEVARANIQDRTIREQVTD